MRAILLSFKMLIKHISRDGMLLMVCIAPVLMIALLYWVLPQFIEPILPFDIKPYYLIFDLFSAIMISYIFCFASSMAVLEELDDNISPYLSVTPLGKVGYLVSRLLIPAVISILVTICILNIWSFTKPTTIDIVVISIFLSLCSVIASMLVIVVAKNKVEGMAMSKLSGLIMIGLFIPFFVYGDIQYLFGFLPTLWIAKFAITHDYLYLIPTAICTVVWIALLLRKYQRKIEY